MDGQRLIEAAFDRQADAELVQEMLAGLRRWVLSAHRGAAPPSLGRCLGLPANPERARLWLRDRYLRQAAQALAPGAATWPQALALHREARRFLGHRWPCWWHLASPPAQADQVERALWLATRAAGGKLPGTARRLAQILAA